MDSKFCLEELLCYEKNLIEIYVHATIESSNNSVYKTFYNNLSDSLELQHCIYKLMEQLGYYKVDNVTKKVLDESRKKLLKK